MLLELISKILWLQDHLKKSVVFLHTRKKQLKLKLYHKSMKYFGVNLAKYVQELSTAKYKRLKDAILLCCSFVSNWAVVYTILIKIWVSTSKEMEKLTLAYMEMQRT